MMSRIFKSFALAIVICMLLSCLVSCGDYQAIEPEDGDLTVVGKVGAMEVYLDELRFVTSTNVELMKARYGEDIFEGKDAVKYTEMLRENVFSGICANYATIELCEEALINRGEASIMKRVEQRMAQTVEELGGMTKYKRYLKENDLTDRLVRFSTEIELMQSELMYVYIDDILVIEDDDDTIYDIIKDEFIYIRHIFVPHTEEGAADKISEARSRIATGESMLSLIEQYDRDEAMTADGLFILEGYMTPDYENVAFSLDEGEISDVFSDDSGYYIVERVQMTPLDIMLRFDHLKQLYQTYTFYSILDQRQTELTFEPNDIANEYISRAVYE